MKRWLGRGAIVILLPLAWTWEHDDGRINAPPGRSPQLRGIGGTLAIVLLPRSEESWGPLTISDGRAYADPYAAKVMARRVKSLPQYVAPSSRHAQTARPAPAPKTSDQAIDQIVNRARSPEASGDLGFHRPLHKNASRRPPPENR